MDTRKLRLAALDGFREAWRIARYPSLVMLLVYFTFVVWIGALWLALQ